MFNIFIYLITKKYTKFKLLTIPKKKKLFFQLLQKHQLLIQGDLSLGEVGQIGHHQQVLKHRKHRRV